MACIDGAASRRRLANRTPRSTFLPPTPEFDGLCVVLVNTRNPLNIGAAARAMGNFGVSHLRVVKPYDVAFREARSAVGAAALLSKAREFKTVSEAVADCSLVVGTTAADRRALQQPLRRLEAGANLIRKRLVAGARVALLFGSEKRGLSNDDFSHCHWLLRIPTVDQQPSMNLGQAVATCLYELVRLRRPVRKDAQEEMATAAHSDQISRLLLEALRSSGYVQPGRSAVAEQKVRRMVRRLSLTAEDATLWLGMLRQIVWKLSKTPE